MRAATILALAAVAAVNCVAQQAAPLLPPNGASACNRETFYEATSKERSCGKTMVHRDDPGEQGEHSMQGGRSAEAGYLRRSLTQQLSS